MTEYEIISAFADHESVDPRRLGDALSDEEGRRYLVELLALRALIDETDETQAESVSRPSFAPGRGKSAWPTWMGAVAAALVLGLGSFAMGMQAGKQDARVTAVAEQRPPEPQRVIELREGIEWHQGTGGN